MQLYRNPWPTHDRPLFAVPEIVQVDSFSVEHIAQAGCRHSPGPARLQNTAHLLTKAKGLYCLGMGSSPFPCQAPAAIYSAGPFPGQHEPGGIIFQRDEPPQMVPLLAGRRLPVLRMLAESMLAALHMTACNGPLKTIFIASGTLWRPYPSNGGQVEVKASLAAPRLESGTGRADPPSRPRTPPSPPGAAPDSARTPRP